MNSRTLQLPGDEFVTAGISISSDTKGLGGALSGMSERAQRLGNIVQSYPVAIHEVVYPDAESAYLDLKLDSNMEYNAGLMIDIQALKFVQHPRLLHVVRQNGGVPWLGRCGHSDPASTLDSYVWQGQGIASQFIVSLMHGYQKALKGRGPQTRVVHAFNAPWDSVFMQEQAWVAAQRWLAENPDIDVTNHTHGAWLAYYDYLQKDTSSSELIVTTLRGYSIYCDCDTQRHPHKVCPGELFAAIADGRPWTPPNQTQKSLFD